MSAPVFSKASDEAARERIRNDLETTLVVEASLAELEARAGLALQHA